MLPVDDGAPSSHSVADEIGASPELIPVIELSESPVMTAQDQPPSTVTSEEQNHQPTRMSPPPVSRKVISSPLSLPSLSMAVSEPLFAKLSQLRDANAPSPLDYVEVDAEQISRQSSANARVREILRTLKRPKQQSLDAGPEYINFHPRQVEQPTTGTNPTGSLTGSPIPAPPESRNLVLLTSSSSDDDVEVVESSTVQSTTSPSIHSSRHLATPSSKPSDSPTVASTSSFAPALSSADPPWMSFIGYSIYKEEHSKSSPESTLHNWKQALDQMNRSLDFFGRLHEEICALMYWVEPTPEEMLVRQRVLARIHIVARALWPHCDVQSFGSYYTGLWLPNGDIDVCIMNVEGNPVTNLRVFTLCLTRLGIPLAVEVISSARVPIVKFVDSESGIPVDVSLNTDTALSTSRYVIDNTQKFPWLRPLILLVKLYLQQRSLNETYKGGVGSYLLFVMCLSFLQQHRVCSSPSLMGAVGMGHLVFDFLQLYGRDFNFDTTAVSVRNGGSYFPKEKHLDLGRNSYDIRTVRNCFRQSFHVLTEIHHDWNSGRFDKNRSILEAIIFPQDTLFKNRIRFPMRLHGLSDLERTLWWQEVRVYFDQPIASVRPPPTLPKSLIQQVRADLDAVKGGGVQGCVKGVAKELRGRAPNSNNSGKRRISIAEREKRDRDNNWRPSSKRRRGGEAH